MSKSVLNNLHHDFCIVDRKAVVALHKELERILNWQQRAMRLIKKLRENNVSHTRKHEN